MLGVWDGRRWGYTVRVNQKTGPIKFTCSALETGQVRVAGLATWYTPLVEPLVFGRAHYDMAVLFLLFFFFFLLFSSFMLCVLSFLLFAFYVLILICALFLVVFAFFFALPRKKMVGGGGGKHCPVALPTELRTGSN